MEGGGGGVGGTGTPPMFLNVRYQILDIPEHHTSEHHVTLAIEGQEEC